MNSDNSELLLDEPAAKANVSTSPEHELLRQFCSQDSGRYALSNPFHYHGHGYATDGRILVRMPGVVCPFSSEKAPMASDIFDQRPAPALEMFKPLQPLIELPASCMCDGCCGCGITNCGECGHDRECPSCGGKGSVEFKNFVLLVGGEIVAYHYIWKISKLPGLLVSPTADGQALCFIFDGGGEGRLMARSVDEFSTPMRHLTLAAADLKMMICQDEGIEKWALAEMQKIATHFGTDLPDM